jgi:protein ImuA
VVVWRADELARNGRHAARWPCGTGCRAARRWLAGGALVEVPQPQAGRASGGCCCRRWRRPGGALVLVNPPHRPFVPALAAQGLDASRLLVLQGPMLARDAAARVWACEQALRGAGVSAVLAWLPQVRPEQLRRLQMAAQNFQQALFVMRPLAAQQEASPAVLRLLLSPARPDALTLRLLKRRGPPPTTPLVLPARPTAAGLRRQPPAAVRRRQGSGTVLPPRPRLRHSNQRGATAAGAHPRPCWRLPGALDRLVASAVR